MQKKVDYVKQYIGVISIVLAVCILLTYSFSHFKINIESKKAAEMYIGELKYAITIDGKSTNTLTIPAGETIVDINLTNQNEIKTYYKLLYSNNNNISISYYEQTKNTNDEITSYKSPGDSIENKSSNSIKLKIINNSTSNQYLTFKVSGGYSTNTLQDVEVPDTYTEITTLETPSTNTYFCKTNDTLTQGTEFVKGQYTYRYKQEVQYSSGLNWFNISNDGWGVQLTNRESTDPVTSKLCTYINNKPITSMSHMFYESNATAIDLSSFDTSNVTNMSEMFRKSAAISIDVSNFDTSNVTNMGYMFLYSQTTTLDVSNFDTSNVTDMHGMFFNSKATTIDVSNFDTSKVKYMSQMFTQSVATTIDVSNFDTRNVIYMDEMFYDSQATSIDVSNFNTSKVTDMRKMFYKSKATSIDLSSFDTSNVTNMSEMFYSNPNLKTIYASDKFNTNAVTSSTNMFYNSTKLVGGAGTTYNSSYVDKTYARIDGGTSNPGYFTRK
ncbi:MAG: BspA family leucine-rich repeat surface protein [Bacilli bacterium]